MKKFYIFGVAMIMALAMNNCGPKTTAPRTEKEEIPCFEESRSTNTHFKECGIGEDADLPTAKANAIKHANSLMEERLAKEIKKTVEKDHGVAITDEYQNLAHGALDFADNDCESQLWLTDQNKYRYYYTIVIAKDQFKKYLEEHLSK